VFDADFTQGALIPFAGARTGADCLWANIAGVSDDEASKPNALYLDTCRRLGVEPAPRERAREFVAEWAAAFEHGGEPPH